MSAKAQQEKQKAVELIDAVNKFRARQQQELGQFQLKKRQIRIGVVIISAALLYLDYGSVPSVDEDPENGSWWITGLGLLGSLFLLLVNHIVLSLQEKATRQQQEKALKERQTKVARNSLIAGQLSKFKAVVRAHEHSKNRVVQTLLLAVVLRFKNLVSRNYWVAIKDLQLKQDVLFSRRERRDNNLWVINLGKGSSLPAPALFEALTAEGAADFVSYDMLMFLYLSRASGHDTHALESRVRENNKKSMLALKNSMLLGQADIEMKDWRRQIKTSRVALMTTLKIALWAVIAYAGYTLHMASMANPGVSWFSRELLAIAAADSHLQEAFSLLLTILVVLPLIYIISRRSIEYFGMKKLHQKRAEVEKQGSPIVDNPLLLELARKLRAGDGMSQVVSAS